MPEKLFDIRKLTKIYPMGEVQVNALKNIDLNLFKGELIVLLGPSGSGKSTLLNCLGGLDTASSGEIFYLDQNQNLIDLSKLSEKSLTEYRRNNVGFVFQFYNLISSLTALENVSIITEISNNPMKPSEALAWVGLTKRLNHFPAQLSGGEQQRVAIARAIAKNPNILLCDEPTGALDFTTGILVLEALKRINETLGTTTILITHNIGIAKMADRIIHLADGMIVDNIINQQKINPSELTW